MIREMTFYDIDRVYEIENESFFEPWSKKILINELLNNKLTKHFVLEKEGIIVGFYISRFVIDESELDTIAIKKEYRGQGLGEKLMNHYIKYCKSKGVKKISLEVRVTNEAAINLYEKYGFVKRGIRKNYYSYINEDAYTMTREVE